MTYVAPTWDAATNRNVTVEEMNALAQAAAAAAGDSDAGVTALLENTSSTTYAAVQSIAAASGGASDATVAPIVEDSDSATYAAVEGVVDAHLGGDATGLLPSINALRPTSVLSRLSISKNVDATAVVQAGLDALDATQGGTYTLPTVNYPIRIDGTIRVDTLKALEIPAGVELARLSTYSSNPEPVVNLAGNHAALIGAGLVSSQNVSPHGVAMIGPTVITKADFSATMTAGSPNLTVSADRDTFTSDDVGKSVGVLGAGAGGGWLTGTVSSVTDSTHAVLSVNAAVTVTGTAAAYWGVQQNVCWTKIQSGIRVKGSGIAGSEGVYVQSSPQRITGITLGARIECQVQGVTNGVGFHLQANGNTVVNPQFYQVSGSAIFFDDAVENGILGGFVHNSPNLQQVVRGKRSVINTIQGLQGEPGAGAAYNLDAYSTGNTFYLNVNTPGAVTDLGANNSIFLGTDFRGQRVSASDGLILPITSGGYTDSSFFHTPLSGLTAIDSSTYSRLQARVGTVWKSVRLYTLVSTIRRVVTPPSIAAGATWDYPIAVTGVAMGDFVDVSPNVMLASGLMWIGAVSAANTVTIRIANITTAAITPASATWTIDVRSAS